MSGKNPKYNKPVKKAGQKLAKPVPQVKAAIPDYPPWHNYALLGGILLITFWCYHYTLSNQFTNWDDGLYIYENPYIKNLSANLNKIIFTSAGIAYYHPLTMLTLAVNWKYYGANPESYYAFDILMHLLNTLLVFFLSRDILNAMVKKGYGKIKGIPYLAAFCALLHGIHPMHVESVSWIAERKDVLYLFFYLLGLMAYVKYAMEMKLSQMVIVGLMYLLALFSKPMAVVFPLTLFAFDVLLKRKIEWFLLVEKIPLFAISVLSGILTYISSDKSGSITSSNVFTLIQKLSFVGVNYLSYLGKYFVPVHLCSYYPYPELTESNGLPFLYYLGPFFAVGITLGLLYLAYKAGENYFRVALFGFGFYFFNVMFILQFISAGPAIMADRYSYAAYLGVSFILVYFIYVLIDKIPSFKTPVIVVLAAFSCMLAFLCQARTEVWHNTKTLWQDVIKKYPATVDTTYNADRSQYVLHVHPGVETSYKNLGNYYVQDKNPPDYDSAYMSYVVLEQTKSKDAGVYSNLGNIWAIRGNMKKSLAEYSKAISLNNKSFDVYLDRAITYARIGVYDSAMRDFNHAYMLDSTNQKLFEQRGFTLLNGVKNYKAAIADYNRLIAIDPTNMEYYRYRGLAEVNSGNTQVAIEDFTRVINTNPKDAECLYFFSFAYNKLNLFPKAIEYAQKAQQGGYKLPDGYIEGLQKLAKKNGQ
jgi:protein O-mannosyl-transferase